MNPLTRADQDLLIQRNVHIEIDQTNPASPTGVIIFDQRRFKVSVLNQPRVGEVIATTEEQMRITASKVAVMLLKKDLLQQQPQAQLLDLKINRQGMTLQNDHNRLIQHTDADENKNTQPDYDALADYLTAPLPQPNAEIEEPEEAVNLDVVVREHPQIPPQYIAVHPQLAEYIKKGMNPFLDPHFKLAPRNDQRLALMSGEPISAQQEDAEIYMDPALIDLVVKNWEKEVVEKKRLQQEQEQRVLIEEVLEKEVEAIQEKKSTDALNSHSSAIVPIPHPIPSASTQTLYYHPAYLLLPSEMRMQWAGRRVLGMNGVFLDPVTRTALSLGRSKPLTLTAAPQTREGVKTGQPLITASSEQPTKAEDESKVSEVSLIDLARQPRPLNFDWLKNQQSVPSDFFNRNAFNRNPFEQAKDPFKSFDDQQKRFQMRSFPRQSAPVKTPNTPSPIITAPTVVPTPAPLTETPPQKLGRVFTDPTLVQPGNEEATFNYHLKQINKQSGQPNPNRISSFFSNWRSGKPQSQNNTQ